MRTKGEWKCGKALDMEGMRHIFIKVNGLCIGRIDGHKDGISCGRKGAISSEEATANAQHICKCVNSHDDLIKACKMMAREWDERGKFKYGEMGAPAAIFAIKAAIKAGE